MFAGIYERTTGRDGARGKRYVHMEADHAAQTVDLLPVIFACAFMALFQYLLYGLHQSQLVP